MALARNKYYYPAFSLWRGYYSETDRTGTVQNKCRGWLVAHFPRFFFQHITLSSKDLNHEWFVCIYDATIKCARVSLTLCARVFYRWNTYYHMRVYFNFHWHCYIQNKPIAKMFIAIVNTCSMYSLLLFVALFPWWAPSRGKTPVPYKHKATGIDASTRTTIIVAVDTCFARTNRVALF